MHTDWVPSCQDSLIVFRVWILDFQPHKRPVIQPDVATIIRKGDQMCSVASACVRRVREAKVLDWFATRARWKPKEGRGSQSVRDVSKTCRVRRTRRGTEPQIIHIFNMCRVGAQGG